jgi:hypothetical protein
MCCDRRRFIGARSSTCGRSSERSAVTNGNGGGHFGDAKQERKAARKQARANKNAELKKLEDAGYKPGARDDSNYPQDIQEAQKKAGIGQSKQ